MSQAATPHLDTITGARVEVEAIKARTAELQSLLQQEQAAHARTSKQKAGLETKVARLEAKLAQRGPLDSQQEQWLMQHGATIKCQLGTGKAAVKVALPRRPLIRANSISEGIAEACKKFGGPA